MGVISSEFNSKFQHVLAEQRHPGRAVCLLKMAAGRQRGTSVEYTDIIQAQESAFEYILAKRGLSGLPTR